MWRSPHTGCSTNSHSLTSSEKQMEKTQRGCGCWNDASGMQPMPQRREGRSCSHETEGCTALGGVCTAPEPQGEAAQLCWHKVRLECSTPFSLSACYFAVANLQNKIYFYLCSPKRADKELIFQGFSWTCISLASISEGKS